MSKPFDIHQAMDELYDVLALAHAAKAMQESGGDSWRVLDVLGDRLKETINRLDGLDLSMRRQPVREVA